MSGTLPVAVSAADASGVASVVITYGSASVTDTTAPYTASIDTTTLANGPLTISARATDMAGNNATATVTVTVSNTVTPPPPPPPSGTVSNAPIGTNMAGTADWETSTPFIDLMATAREFTTASYGNASSIITARDANGWPTAISAPILSILLTTLPYDHSGTYVLRWEGNATGLSLGGGASNLRCDDGTTNLGACASKRALFSLGATSQLTVNIGSLVAADPVKNIRILPPGGVCGTSPTALSFAESCSNTRGGYGSCSSGKTCYDFDDVAYNRYADATTLANSKAVFHPKFLETMTGVRTVRFMDWMHTNETDVTDWNTRPLLKMQTYASVKGVPVEMMVALANQLGADAWLTIPHKATDAYVSNTAAYVAANLLAPRKAYVEYSNETWNGGFVQASYVQTQGRAAGYSTASYDAGWYYTVMRSSQIAKLFKTAFGADSSRVVGVFGSQAANAWWTGEALRWLTARTGTTASVQGIDAVAIAPYFGGYMDDSSCGSVAKSIGVDGVIAEIQTGGRMNSCGAPAGGAVAEAVGWMNETAAQASKYGIAMVAYEGGPHLVGINGMENDATLTSVFQSVNRDPRMKAILLDYFGKWKAAGGQVFSYFTGVSGWSKWGSWGSSEHMLQSRAQAPKLDAIKTFNETTACWWNGCTR